MTFTTKYESNNKNTCTFYLSINNKSSEIHTTTRHPNKGLSIKSIISFVFTHIHVKRGFNTHVDNTTNTRPV